MDREPPVSQVPGRAPHEDQGSEQLYGVRMNKAGALFDVLKLLQPGGMAEQDAIRGAALGGFLFDMSNYIEHIDRENLRGRARGAKFPGQVVAVHRSSSNDVVLFITSISGSNMSSDCCSSTVE